MPIRSAELFRRHVRELIEERGITMQSVADAAGIKRPNFSRILSGQENVTLDRAERIATALGVKLHQLITPISDRVST